MHFIKTTAFSFLFTALFFSAQGQTKKTEWQPDKRPLIQFSGVVVSSDSLEPIPFTSLIVKNTSRGTIGDYFGYFSFVAQTLDTIEFSAIGHKRGFFVIPDTLTGNKY